MDKQGRVITAFSFLFAIVANTGIVNAATTGDHERRCNDRMKHCIEWYNSAIQNACVQNSYVSRDQSRSDRCRQDLLKRRSSCEERVKRMCEANSRARQ